MLLLGSLGTLLECLNNWKRKCPSFGFNLYTKCCRTCSRSAPAGEKTSCSPRSLQSKPNICYIHPICNWETPLFFSLRWQCPQFICDFLRLVSFVECLCIPLPLSLSFYSILVEKCVFNIVNHRLCFHATSTTGNSALTNNKKRLSDFSWKGVQDKCSVQCPTTGMRRCGSWAAVAIGRAVAMWKIHHNRENTKQSQGMKQLGWLLRPVLVGLLRCSVGTMALWQCFMETWRCQGHIAEGH